MIGRDGEWYPAPPNEPVSRGKKPICQHCLHEAGLDWDIIAEILAAIGDARLFRYLETIDPDCIADMLGGMPLRGGTIVALALEEETHES